MTKWSYACTQCHQAQCKCNQTTATAIKPRPQRGANARGYTYRWQKASKVYLVNNPLCVRCESLGKVEAAAHVDHVVPHRGDVHGDAFWDEANWQALCARCHGWKTQREAGMGLRYVVAGSAGCGKSTYVADHASKGDLIWDYDRVLAQLVHGLENKRDNPPTLIGLMQILRDAFVNWIRTDATERNVWVIASNPTTAGRIAQKLTAQLISLEGGASGEERVVC